MAAEESDRQADAGQVRDGEHADMPVPTTSLSEFVSIQLSAAGSAASRAYTACCAQYDNNLSTRIAVWVAACAAGIVFLQNPVNNTLSILSGLLSLSIYTAVVLALLAAAAHQIHRSEHANAVQQLKATASPSVPVPMPQRLPQEQSMSPAEIFTQRWKLPRAVVAKLGMPRVAGYSMTTSAFAEPVCSADG